MPRESHLFKECNEKIEELVLSLTLPLYFALSGLKTDVTEINTADQGAMVVLVCFIATVGKVRLSLALNDQFYFSLLMRICQTLRSTLELDRQHTLEACRFERVALLLHL